MYRECVRRLSRQGVSVAAVLMAATSLAAFAFVRHPGRSEVDASLWFDDVPFTAAELGGTLPAEDLATIQRIAHDEVQRAFAGLPIRFSAARSSTPSAAASAARRCTSSPISSCRTRHCTPAAIAPPTSSTPPRAQQFVGEMHWDLAWPMLESRLKR
jgi:hypothetical protein